MAQLEAITITRDDKRQIEVVPQFDHPRHADSYDPPQVLVYHEDIAYFLKRDGTGHWYAADEPSKQRRCSWADSLPHW